jgi:hypothetical protein
VNKGSVEFSRPWQEGKIAHAVEIAAAGQCGDDAAALTKGGPTMRKLLFALLLTLAAPARSEPLDNPYGGCSQQTLDEAVALSQLPGDRDFLRDHLRSYGCRLVYPNEAFRPFAPERGERKRTEGNRSWVLSSMRARFSARRTFNQSSPSRPTTS